MDNIFIWVGYESHIEKIVLSFVEVQNILLFITYCFYIVLHIMFWIY